MAWLMAWPVHDIRCINYRCTFSGGSISIHNTFVMQVREASALGLLDGLLVPPGVVLPETLGPRAWALSRRTASLSRFLLDHMYSLGKDGAAAAGGGVTGSSPPTSPVASASAGAPFSQTRPPPPPAALGQAANTSSTAVGRIPGGSSAARSGIPQPHPANLALVGRLDDLAGVRYRQVGRVRWLW